MAVIRLSYLTFIFNLTVLDAPPVNETLHMITADPFDFAVTFPFLDTIATFLLELLYVILLT